MNVVNTKLKRRTGDIKILTSLNESNMMTLKTYELTSNVEQV